MFAKIPRSPIRDISHDGHGVRQSAWYNVAGRDRHRGRDGWPNPLPCAVSRFSVREKDFDFDNFWITRMIVTAFLLALGAAMAVQPAPPQAPMSRSISEPVRSAPVGTLRDIGGIPGMSSGSSVTRLPDGKVLVYGSDPIMHGVRDTSGKPVITLRNRLRVSRRYYGVGADFGARMWDPQGRTWKNIPAPPECAGAAYLHTATALPNGKVLVAGGLCDVPNQGSTVSPYWTHVPLSLWNSGSEAWEPAPALHEARIYHSATLMPDGSVLLIGGESDPALTSSGDPVLASVEQYEGSEVRLLPPLHVARARHTASLLSNGDVLVAGGIDREGHAIDSAELWDASTRNWRELPAMHRARYAHSATVLEDGRVLVAGGIGPQGRALDSVELWDPAANRWFTGASLSRPMRSQGALRLANGNVLLAGGEAEMRVPAIDWAVLWNPKSDTWQAAGKAGSDPDSAQPPAMFPAPGDGALIFVERQILQWQSGTTSAPPEQPLLRGKPALVALANGGLMVIGDTGELTWTAHVWNPQDDSWTPAGTLDHGFHSYSRAIELPARRILLVGLGDHNDAFCQISDIPQLHWEDCGHLTFKQRVASPIGMGLMPDGRVAVVAAVGEAFLYDVKTSRWSPTPIEWNEKDLVYGAPVRVDHPLAKLHDPRNDEWLDVTAEAATYMDAAIHDNKSDVPDSSRPALLWDGRQQQWAYVLPRRKMGHEAQLLPDGCAFSWSDFSLFNPDTGEVSRLLDPGVGVAAFDGSMIALADGTVVFAGTPQNDLGPGFFHRKVSCAGFAASPADLIRMPADGAGHGMTKSLALARLAVPRRRSQVNLIGTSVWNYFQGNVWPLLAVLGVLLLYGLLRFVILPLVRATARRTMSPSSLAMLTRELPSPVASATRIVIYGLLALVAASILIPYLYFADTQSALACETQASACLNSRTAILDSIPELEGASSNHPKPTVPCRFVGAWSSRQGSLMFRVNLYDDGTFVELPGSGGVGDPNGYRGYWMVQGDSMVWVDKTHPEYGPDINPIIEQSHHRFVLVEHNGRHTKFEWIKPVISEKCKIDASS
jgi:hypothetical protein